MERNIDRRGQQSSKSDVVGVYLEFLLNGELSGRRFPIDFDLVWPIAYSSRSHAKKALTESGEFWPGEDYQVQGTGDAVAEALDTRPSCETIMLSTQCLEFFIARKRRVVFEIYRQCRQTITQAL